MKKAFLFLLLIVLAEDAFSLEAEVEDLSDRACSDLHYPQSKLRDPRDPELTERIIELLEKYPAPWVARAILRLRVLQADNPRKNVYYLAGILAGWALEDAPR